VRAIFVLAMLLVSSIAWAATPALEGQMYVDGRAKLIADGWTPYQVEDSDCINQTNETCQKFPEIRFCSSSGACQMTWRKDGEVITVDTFGDFNDITGVREGLVP
jgi:hypothetical protein